MTQIVFNEWIRELEEDVIQGEFGFEPGEFIVYREHWRPAFREGLTPIAAWNRALAAHKDVADKREKEHRENFDRINADDEVFLARQIRDER